MDNLIIESGNLLALEALLSEYEGKIDVIPIDPPYNTEIEYVGYKDSKFADGWFEFMKPRLELSYQLLSNNGVMFIHIDENELVNLIKLCSDTFGCGNVSTVIWKKTNERFDANRIEKPYINNIRKTHEYIVVCFKDRKSTSFNNIMQPVWNGINFINKYRPIETIIDELGTTSSAKDEIAELLGDRNVFSTPKPMRLIKELVRAAGNRQSIVLDFFAGSGTTGHAVMDLNKEDGGERKFILITNNESDIFHTVTIPRIEAAIKKYGYTDTYKAIVQASKL